MPADTVDRVTTFDPGAHVYTIAGVVVPSVTQVLEEECFIDFSRVPDDTLEAAQARGTYVHTALHYHLEGDLELDDVDPQFLGYVESALAYIATVKKRQLRDADGQVIGVEYRFWNARRMYAGTVDWLGWDPDDVLAIDDWKTGEPGDVAAPLQTAAYEAGVRECLLPTLLPVYRKPIRRRAVKLFKDGKAGRPDPYDDPRDLAQFYNALTCVHFRRNGLRHSR